MSEQSALLPAGRKAELAAYVTASGQVTVKALAAHFGVSADTIRRDLDQLGEEGVLVRTHGGAVSPTALPRADTDMDVRSRLQTKAKDVIGELAASLVADGSVLMINAGTTTLAAARHLSSHRELTIATNNLRIPLELAPKVFRNLYMFGGDVRQVSQATIGPVGFRSSSGREIDIRCDIALIGVGGVSADGGYSTSNLSEAEMMREMMSRAAKVAILADSTKMNRRLFVRIAELDRADYLVTDKAPPADLAEELRRADVAVVIPD